jgi:hypothetical protein
MIIDMCNTPFDADGAYGVWFAAEQYGLPANKKIVDEIVDALKKGDTYILAHDVINYDIVSHYFDEISLTPKGNIQIKAMRPRVGLPTWTSQ